MPALPSIPSTIAMLLAVALSLFLAANTIIERSIDAVNAIRSDEGADQPEPEREPEPEPEPPEDLPQTVTVVAVAGGLAVLGTVALAVVVRLSRRPAKPRKSSVNGLAAPPTP